MLELYPNKYALVVSHENMTNNWYPGSDRSMLVPNAIFRMNGAAILLSNKSRDARRCKYVLEHLVRTTVARDDDAFRCVFQCEDAKGVRGVSLRIGRGELVNLEMVRELMPWFSGTWRVKLSNGEERDVSRERARQLKEAMGIE